jgi:steroid delta-isomerase-like uncharacterized protein
MSPQSNAKLAQEIYNAFSNNQYDDVLARSAEDVEIVFTPTGQVYQGHDGFKAFMQGFKGAFPNIRLNIKDQVATDDAVVTEFMAVGTHTGPLQTPAGDIPATGRTAEWPVVEVWRVKNGKVVSLHNYQDLGTMLRQLGLAG